MLTFVVVHVLVLTNFLCPFSQRQSVTVPLFSHGHATIPPQPSNAVNDIKDTSTSSVLSRESYHDGSVNGGNSRSQTSLNGPPNTGETNTISPNSSDISTGFLGTKMAASSDQLTTTSMSSIHVPKANGALISSPKSLEDLLEGSAFGAASKGIIRGM